MSNKGLDKNGNPISLNPLEEAGHSAAQIAAFQETSARQNAENQERTEKAAKLQPLKPSDNSVPALRNKINAIAEVIAEQLGIDVRVP